MDPEHQLEQQNLDIHRRWRWFSTTHSANALQVSVLAIFETLLAIGCYIWIAVNWGTLHLVLAACVTPLLLLRTPASIHLGLRMAFKGFAPYARFSQWETKIEPKWVGVALLIILYVPDQLYISLLFPIVRFTATFITVIRHPLLSIKSIPSNWWRIVACVDSCHPPEPIPGYYTNKNEPWIQQYLNDKAVHEWREWFDLSGFQLRRGFGNIDILAPLGFVISLWYRWSLKGTSIIYMPLVWVVRGTFTRTPWHILREIKQLFFYWLQRAWSMLFLIFIGSKLVFVTMWAEIATSTDNTEAGFFLDAFVVPTSIPLWQVAAGLNSLLAWIIYGIADLVDEI